jgi:hypothetical protein
MAAPAAKGQVMFLMIHRTLFCDWISCILEHENHIRFTTESAYNLYLTLL